MTTKSRPLAAATLVESGEAARQWSAQQDSDMKGFFGGPTVPLRRDIGKLQSSEIELRRFARHAFVDRFAVDLDQGMILLGPLAREFHGIISDGDEVGMRQFLDCYHADDRVRLVSLLERLACDERSFHYTARLAGPGGRFVHGFIARADGEETRSADWAGVVVMSRSGLDPADCGSEKDRPEAS